MTTAIIQSLNGIPIRLTSERWVHITEEHCELAGMREEVLTTVANPLRILAGTQGEFIAVRTVEQGKFLVVPYREEGTDGFIITAFLTRRINYLDRRTQVWPL
ncbi:MAG: hypothetical protein F4Z85_06925 [Gemmatimonadetes bacterium]|nr:hypothetical protein [Gemmatimonadota bacterium]MYB66936.1 hypothetical protein [Gemmatimonadota bacterium]